MKILLSEANHDYGYYLYPYVVWGFLESGETPADAFAAGFMPGTPDLDRWYLVRQVRVPLTGWRPSSENRRVLRKAARMRCDLIPRQAFPDSPERRERWLSYAAAKWGAGVMPDERLDRLMRGAVITHLLHYTDVETGAELGTALMYCEPPRVAFYYYAFYDLTPSTRYLGMAMMTLAVQFCADAGYEHLHLGTCYSEMALYKTQFEPLEFWNGFRWSPDLRELKHLVREPLPAGAHRLATPAFLEFQPAPPAILAAQSPFSIRPASTDTAQG